jgi:hypothetical protein
MTAAPSIRAALSAFLDALTPGELRELDEIAGEIVWREATPADLNQATCTEYVRRRVAGWERWGDTLERVRGMAAGDPAQGRAATATLPAVSLPTDDAATCNVCGKATCEFDGGM